MRESSFYLLNKSRSPEYNEKRIQTEPQIKIVTDNQTMACGMPYCKIRLFFFY